MFIETHNVIFVHVPKTGGNSLTTHFVNKLGARAHLIRRDSDTFELKDSATDRKHQPLRAYQKMLGPRFQECTVIWVWRDPIDRLTSWFFSPHRKPKTLIKRLQFERTLTRQNFARFVQVKNNLTHYVHLNHGPFPKGVVQIDFGQLATGVRNLEQSLGLMPSDDIPWVNRSFSPRRVRRFRSLLVKEGLLEGTHHLEDYRIAPELQHDVSSLVWAGYPHVARSQGGIVASGARGADSSDQRYEVR